MKWQTTIKLWDDRCREVFESICADITQKDETFSWIVLPGVRCRWAGVIYSSNEDTAHRRGLLFTKKYLLGHGIKTGYRVKRSG
jgi:hypothetical protein